MKPITKSRFDALAGYIRRPESLLLSEEVEWHSDERERVLAVLARDRTDGDFGGVVLGRDTRRRFRAVDVTGFSDSRDFARDMLSAGVELWSRKPDTEFSQGDERGTPLDVFIPVAPTKRLSPAFLKVATAEGFSPARAVIESMMPYYEDVDGNFVEQFQTTSFDARFWELYTFALLNEQGFAFDRSFKAPDFLAHRPFGRVFVEAVTVNPTVNEAGLVVEPTVPVGGDFKEYYLEYMPIKWGSALTSKLKKKYWELDHVVGHPIVLAVQDFHVPRAMTFLSHSITAYLYGISFAVLYNAAGKLSVGTTPRAYHEWQGKRIESGFFRLPGSEFISAVVTNPTATISKFNRMAHVAGFRATPVRMICKGFCHDHNEDAAVSKPFALDVNDPGYTETWVQGANVFHNPFAMYPLDESFLVGAAHHWFDGRVVRSLIPEFHPYQSQTIILTRKRLRR